MTRAIYQEFVLTGPSVWSLIAAFLKANASACIEAGKPLRIFITTHEKKRTNEQNARLWAYCYKTIAEQAWVNKRQYDADTWHEYLGDKFLPKIEKTMPDGRILSRRMSTTELSVSQMVEYQNEVERYAAQELNVEWSA